MARSLSVALCCLAIALAAAPHAASAAGPAAAGTGGPFAGVVVEGQTNAHLYSTPGPPMHCILPVTYVVTLKYAPASDALTLTANGVSDLGSAGFAQVSFEAACWTQFAVTVSGTDVAFLAAYEATVGQGGPPSK
jgi:hypothetical protein